MPIIYFNDKSENALSSLSKEPYLTFEKKFNSVTSNLNSKIIEIDVGSNKVGFANGFFSDNNYMSDLKLTFLFGQDTSNCHTYIRMNFSFVCNDCNYEHYKRQSNLLKQRANYFFIPYIRSLDLSYQVNDRHEIIFDVIADTSSDTKTICLSLINQIIAILSFED